MRAKLVLAAQHAKKQRILVELLVEAEVLKVIASNGKERYSALVRWDEVELYEGMIEATIDRAVLELKA
jgi:hypothetical protein